MDLSEAREVFIQETSELLEKMESILLGQLENPSGDAEAVGSLFRAVHTIKGSAGIFGFHAIEDFSHELETLMDRTRNGEIPLNARLVELLLRARDHLFNLSQVIQIKEESQARVMQENLTRNGESLLEEIRSFSSGGAAPSASSETEWIIRASFRKDFFRHGLDFLPVIRNLKKLGIPGKLQFLDQTLPDLQSIDAESCYVGFELHLSTDRGREEILAEFDFLLDDSELQIDPAGLTEQSASQTKAQTGAGARSAGTESAEEGKSSSGASAARFIRVESTKLDHLVNLVGELVIGTAQMNQLAENSGNTDLTESAYNIQKLVSEIRDGAFRLRMVPIGGTFSRFQRVVHDLSGELGKDVILDVHGQETELDKSIVEKLYDPLLHLVRNSMDHGMETVEVRRKLGKPVPGHITLNAFHEGSEIIIEIRDDGAGLNADRILARALERGLAREGERPPDRDIYRFIFQPGFSTAEAVTSLSGRGVGLDVVKREIESLRGRVEIESYPGEGAVFRIRLPLTLAIIDGLSVRVGGDSFIIPLEIVRECLEYNLLESSADPDQERKTYINLRGEVLPFINLRRFFNVSAMPSDKENIVVISHAGRKSGVLVDEIQGEVQSVIKPIGKLLGNIGGVSGSTVLGDGRISLILDIPSIEDVIRSDMPHNGMPDLRSIRDSARNLTESVQDN